MNASIEKLEPVAVSRQSGMTLIELTVVLLVLIGLAGMLLPYVGGFASRTHDAANTTSEAELVAAIGRYESQYMEYPSDMDSLQSNGVMINYTMADRGGLANNMGTKYGFVVRPIGGTALCGSLRKAGFQTFKTMDLAVDATATPVIGANLGAAFNPTFNYYLTGAAITAPVQIPGAGACVGSVIEAKDNGAIADSLGMSIDKVVAKRALGHTWIVVGMGTASEAIGRTIQDAPVHFAQGGNMNASNSYNRLLVFFEVDGNVAATDSPCTNTVAAGGNCSGAGGSPQGIDSPRAMGTAWRPQLAGTAMAMSSLLGKNYSLGSFYSNMQQ